MKKVLIICYSFPPHSGIGGRRWAKFAKYLSKDDCSIFVIGALNREVGKSVWSKDVINNSKIQYHPIETRFYNFFHNYSSTFFNKVKYRLSKIWLETFFKGNFYDKALPSNDLFFDKAKQLIQKESISNVVITIAPNRLVEVGEKLKKEFPHINLIIDVRDPWNICNDEWDHKYLTEERKQHEIKCEKAALKVADKVFSVADLMTDHYISLFKSEDRHKFITVPNGYDTEEISVVKRNSKANSDGIRRIVFAGTLYDNVTGSFEAFVKAVKEINDKKDDAFKNIEFQFYIHRLPVFENIVARYNCQNILFLEHLPLHEIQNVINESYACMLFLPPNYEFSLSTKFFEYISKDKKILVFSKPGLVPDLVKKHNLGYVMNPETMQQDLQKALTELDSERSDIPHSFNLESYSVENITNSIKQYFI